MLLVLCFPHREKVRKEGHDLYQIHPIEIMLEQFEEERHSVDYTVFIVDHCESIETEWEMLEGGTCTWYCTGTSTL
jgi:predicted nuclease with RNAse H fold